jgi:Mg2+-importing ATPase
MEFAPLTTKTWEEIFAELKTSPNGLSEKEAARRLKIYGPNEVKIKETGRAKIFVRQLKSPFSYLLFIATLIALLVGERVEGFLIFSFVVINTLLGFFQEARAAHATRLLKKYIPEKTRVVRSSQEMVLNKTGLVPGDLVILTAGDIVPADLRVVDEKSLLVDETVLTGESAPVAKTSEPLTQKTAEIFKAHNILFAGTAIVSGEARGVTVGTGRNTTIGEISQLVAEGKRESAYERSLLAFSRLVLRTVVITIIFVFLANLILKGTANFFDFLIFAIALVVSIIPEALPLVATFALSQGALKLAKEKVVVKRLSAVEDLGDIEILCTDKTGTITENKLTLKKVYAADERKCLLYGLLPEDNNPFDLAILEKTPPEVKRLLAGFKEVAAVPFDSSRFRRNTLLENGQGKRVLVVKGAPEAVIKLSQHFAGHLTKEKVVSDITQESQKGHRILAVGFKNLDHQAVSAKDESDLTFLGFFVFADPLKRTAKPAIALAQKLGVKIKIVTGDRPETAGFVAKETGLIDDPRKVIRGETLEALSPREFAQACENYTVFARVAPQTKYQIVEALQKKYAVGFLGEGINDAPALKIANLAVAVQTAADVSREAADIILLKKDLQVIVEGIKEGRNIFANINKYIKCTLASNFGNFYSIAFISLLIKFLPLLPVQILLVNLLSDFPLIAVASDTVDIQELKRPKVYQLKRFVPLIILLAVVSSAFDLLFFAIFHRQPPALIQTLWFIESVLTELLLIFSIRTSGLFWQARRPSPLLLAFSVATIIATVALPFTGLGQKSFGFISPPLIPLLTVLLLLSSYFILSEIVKLSYFKKMLI